MIKNYILRNKQILNPEFSSKTDYETKQKAWYDNYYQTVTTENITPDALNTLNKTYEQNNQKDCYKYQNYCEVSNPIFQANDYISLSKLEMQNLHDVSGKITIKVYQNYDTENVSQIDFNLDLFQSYDDILDLIDNQQIVLKNYMDATNITEDTVNITELFEIQAILNSQNQFQNYYIEFNGEDTLAYYDISKIQITVTGNHSKLLGFTNLLFIFKHITAPESQKYIKEAYENSQQYYYLSFNEGEDNYYSFELSSNNTSKFQYLILESDQVNGNLVCQQNTLNNQIYTTFNQNTLAVITPQEKFQYDNQFNDIHMPLTQSSGYMQFKLYDQNNQEFDQDVFQIQIQLYQQQVFRGSSSYDSGQKSLELHKKKQSFLKITPLTNSFYFNNFQPKQIAVSKVGGYTHTSCIEGNIFYLEDTLSKNSFQFDVTETIWSQDFVDKICEYIKSNILSNDGQTITGTYYSNGLESSVKLNITLNEGDSFYMTTGEKINNVASQMFNYNDIEKWEETSQKEYYTIENNQTEQQILDTYCQQVGSSINDQLFSSFTNYDQIFLKCDSKFIWKDIQVQQNDLKLIIKQYVKNLQTNQYEQIKNQGDKFIKDTNIEYLIVRLLVK